MRILSCETNKIPVTAILDSSINCNIIGKSIAKIVGLKIDNISNTEIYSPISELNILGIIHVMEISVLSQDQKQEQIKVTNIFITNKPKLEFVLILSQPQFQENVMKVNFSNKTFTLLNRTDIQLVIRPKISLTQLNQFIDNYFNLIKKYATTLDIDLDNQDLKRAFFNGLS